MVENIPVPLVPKVWTINIGGNFSWPNDKNGPAVVITEPPGGGSIRVKKKKRVIGWANGSGRVVRLEFKEWPEEDDNQPDPVWPFTSTVGGDPIDPQAGWVTIPVGQSFQGTLVGTGRILVKYTVYALTSTGQVDENVLPLDPMIVVER